MTRARFVTPARQEFLEQIEHYEREEAGLGARFVAAVEEATARALAFPLAGSIASKSTRRVYLKRFPFVLVYRMDEDGIVVFAVAHHAPKPGYWRARGGGVIAN